MTDNNLPLTEELPANTDAVAAVEAASVPLPERTPAKPKSLTARLRSLFTPKPRDDAFSVFKGVDGTWRWHAIFTNNFQDLEGEILTEKAHDNYIARLDMGLVPMPILMAWHTPGTEHGEADVVWRNGHFIHAIGHFDDTPNAEKAIAYYRKNADKLKMSHGFTAPEWAFDGKHYDEYNTLEITTLPPYAAANPYTSFEELIKMQKDVTDEKRRFIAKLFDSEEKADEVFKDDERRGKMLEALKIAHKDFANLAPTPPPDEGDEEEDGDGETEKALKSIYGDLAVGMNELVNIVTVQAKALDAKDVAIKALETKFDTETAAWQKELDALRAIVNAPPRRPSQDAATVRKETDNLKDALPASDPLTRLLTGAGMTVKGQTS